MEWEGLTSSTLLPMVGEVCITSLMTLEKETIIVNTPL